MVRSWTVDDGGTYTYYTVYMGLQAEETKSDIVQEINIQAIYILEAESVDVVHWNNTALLGVE